MKSLEECRTYIKNEGNRILRKLGKDPELKEKGLLSNSRSIFKVFLLAMAFTLFLAFLAFVQNDSSAYDWFRQLFVLDILLVILIVLSLGRGEYPVRYTPVYAEEFLGPLSRFIDSSLQFSLEKGMDRADFDQSRLPLMKNLDHLSGISKQKSKEIVYSSLGQWSWNDIDMTLTLVNFGLGDRKGGFYYKGIMGKTRLPERVEGKHSFFTDIMKDTLGKSSEELNEKHLVAGTFMGGGWTQYSSQENGLSERNRDYLKKALSGAGNDKKEPAIYVSIKEQDLYIWFDYNKLAFDPVLLTPEKKIKQIGALYSAIRAARALGVKS